MRLNAVRFEGYRGLTALTLDRFGRVALIVGKNNSGKTSVLEGIHAALGPDPADVLARSSRVRGELLEDDIDGRCLFSGYAFQVSSFATVDVVADSRRARLMLSVKERTGEENERSAVLERYNRAFVLVVQQEVAASGAEWSSSSKTHLAATDDGRVALPISYRPRSEPEVTVVHVPAGGLDVGIVGALFDAIVLTPEEPVVVQALQVLDERIERVAAVRYAPGRIRKGGFVVKFRDSDARVPIGSLGDGTWRMLGLVLSVIAARGGVLLIDDIDTGLHYSVMDRMWEMVSTTARRLDVQVVATTHSRDCVESLASVASGAGRGEVSIHRLEPGAEHAVVFDESEIVAAAARGVEVR